MFSNLFLNLRRSRLQDYRTRTWHLIQHAKRTLYANLHTYPLLHVDGICVGFMCGKYPRFFGIERPPSFYNGRASERIVGVKANKSSTYQRLWQIGQRSLVSHGWGMVIGSTKTGELRNLLRTRIGIETTREAGTLLVIDSKERVRIFLEAANTKRIAAQSKYRCSS
jgi:hypothetical protein